MTAPIDMTSDGVGNKPLYTFTTNRANIYHSTGNETVSAIMMIVYLQQYDAFRTLSEEIGFQ